MRNSSSWRSIAACSSSRAIGPWEACARPSTTRCRSPACRRWWISCASSRRNMDESQVRVDRLHILTLNAISHAGLKLLAADRYEVSNHVERPDAILVRSHDMHDMAIPESVRAIGRAGAGVNNIPVAQLSKRGIPVFNAPGANANAVKELVLAGMLIAARNLGPALEFTKNLNGEDIDKTVESGKKQFAGFELPGHTLGVIGLGKIGSLVADAAIRLGMNVLGYDPHITVEAAWSLPSQVRRANSVDEI